MRQEYPLNEAWKFRRLGVGALPASDWEEVCLPHSPMETDANGAGHWQGVCQYEKPVKAVAAEGGARQVFWIGAAMHTARVFLDGSEVGLHKGGYMPFELDLTRELADGQEHCLLVEIDNRDAADVPPGKPFAEIDFCWYGGLYRGVAQRVYPALHVSDEVSAAQVAGGGVFFRTQEADENRALCSVQVELVNAAERVCGAALQVRLSHSPAAFDGSGQQPAPDLAGREENTRLVASAEVSGLSLQPGARVHATVKLSFDKPALWSPASPSLYVLEVDVLGHDGALVDRRTFKVGVRRISFSRSGGFQINGKRVRLRGTNRHQEYPRVGYATSAAADRRDARRIKEAGFDYVRLSHYPQSPAFLEACDELGLVVMNAIPGWQFIGGPAFQDACEQLARELIRRDRNHPCVVLWELSLNETPMSEDFMARMQTAGHEEYPGDQLFTCGWRNAFDVYIHARQHGGIQTWKDEDKAHVVSEYGDWEFYAANEGFDQTTGAGVHAAWSNSRHFRGEGERALLQQAENFTIALNDTLSSPAVLDGQWCMFDYARGYHPLRAACGVSDVYRVPKFSWHFYRSQRDSLEGGPGWKGGAVAFIASHWLETSSLIITVFSNCEEIELTLNGRSLGRQRPCVTIHTQYLPHAPFTFHVGAFEAGALCATGYCGGLAVATHRVCTHTRPTALSLEVDLQGIPLSPAETDVVFAHARLVDAQGALCVGSSAAVSFKAEGARIVGNPVVDTEAGIASLVLCVPSTTHEVRLFAETGDFKAELRLR